MKRRPLRYFVLWQYRVKSGREREFLRLYGPAGKWARLFRRSRAFLGTRLFREVRPRGCFLTLDVWRSRAAYRRFLHLHAARYRALDRSAGVLTLEERRLDAWTA